MVLFQFIIQCDALAQSICLKVINIFDRGEKKKKKKKLGCPPPPEIFYQAPSSGEPMPNLNLLIQMDSKEV